MKTDRKGKSSLMNQPNKGLLLIGKGGYLDEE